MATPPAQAGPPAQPAPPVGARLIALILLIAGVELWAGHHLGWSWQTPWVALVVGAVSKVADWILPKQERDALGERCRRRLHAWLPASRVASAWGLALTLAALVSSVTVTSTDTHGRAKAVLKTADGGALGARTLESGLARFPVLTNPFGRPLRLTVDGFLEESITVFPVVGVRVTPDRDLRRSPSVLFRPPPIGVQTLASGGTFAVAWKRPDGSPQPLAAPQAGPHGAFLVGRAQAIPAASVGLWRLELEVFEVGPAVTSRMLLAWSRPHLVQPVAPLAPGMTLLAEVRTRVGAVVAQVEVTLGSDALTDVALLALGTGG
jgi:hypothetical protein